MIGEKGHKSNSAIWPHENSPVCIWGLHIFWHIVESKHQTGNRCLASQVPHTALCSVFLSHFCPPLKPNTTNVGGWGGSGKLRENVLSVPVHLDEPAGDTQPGKRSWHVYPPYYKGKLMKITQLQGCCLSHATCFQRIQQSGLCWAWCQCESFLKSNSEIVSCEKKNVIKLQPSYTTEFYRKWLLF